jgi:hypothetical protein
MASQKLMSWQFQLEVSGIPASDFFATHSKLHAAQSLAGYDVNLIVYQGNAL